MVQKIHPTALRSRREATTPPTTTLVTMMEELRPASSAALKRASTTAPQIIASVSALVPRRDEKPPGASPDSLPQLAPARE